MKRNEKGKNQGKEWRRDREKTDNGIERPIDEDDDMCEYRYFPTQYTYAI